MIPEGSKAHNDLIDILIEAAQKVEEVDQPDGSKQKQMVADPEILWWKTNIVNSPHFGRFAYELKGFEHLAEQCYNNMSNPRAAVMAQQILAIASSFRRSIDAKSSESLRDKQNTQSTLIDKINRNKIEKAFTLKGEAKRTFKDALLGKEAEREMDE